MVWNWQKSYFWSKKGFVFCSIFNFSHFYQNCRSLFSNLISLPLTGRPFLKIQKSRFYKIYLYKRCWHKIINKSMFPVQNLKKSTTKCKFDPFFEDRKCNSHLFSAILPIAIFFIRLIFHTWTIVAWFQTIQKSLCGNLDFRDTKKLIFSPKFFKHFCFQKFEKKFTDTKFGPLLNVLEEKSVKNCIAIAV